MSPLPLLLLAAGCQDYSLEPKAPAAGSGEGETASTPGLSTPPLPMPDGGACPTLAAEPADVAPTDACHYAISGFEPLLAWDVPGTKSLALPAVGDLDGDGVPEIAVIWTEGVMSPGSLAVYRGDGGGLVWTDTRRGYAPGSGAVLADTDGDGEPEIFAVTVSEESYAGCGKYEVVSLTAAGELRWQTASYTDCEFDHATGLVVSDMDHDGTPEIVAGMVILDPTGRERARAEDGDSRGAPLSGGGMTEGAFPAVADLDLDGVEELVTGNAVYDVDGRRLWRDDGLPDGAVSVANLDADPEGEFVVVNRTTVRAHDTDGALLWGPDEVEGANILASPAIADLDGDGRVEILTAGGDELRAYRADGSLSWWAAVTDRSGATGAAVFDFEQDGLPEVVYIDERTIYAFDGRDGAVRFRSDDHLSPTMYDYPVIADVDVDGHADLLVMEYGSSSGMKVFRDVENAWAPARPVWNQHAYSITNVTDGLGVPTTATPNWAVYNSYHAASGPGLAVTPDLSGQILEVCEEDCDAGWLRVLLRLDNPGEAEVPAGVPLSLYAVFDDGQRLLTTVRTPAAVAAWRSSAGISADVPAAEVASAYGLYLRVDDDGDGVGTLLECTEDNNGVLLPGPFCE